MYQVYDYNPRIGKFYVTCTTNKADMAAAWFRFRDPIDPMNWKYLTVTR